MTAREKAIERLAAALWGYHFNRDPSEFRTDPLHSSWLLDAAVLADLGAVLLDPALVEAVEKARAKREAARDALPVLDEAAFRDACFELNIAERHLADAVLAQLRGGR